MTHCCSRLSTCSKYQCGGLLCLQDHLAGMRWDPAAFKDTTTSYDNVKPAPQSKRIMNEAETLAKRNVVRALLSGQPGGHNTMQLRTHT